MKFIGFFYLQFFRIVGALWPKNGGGQQGGQTAPHSRNEKVGRAAESPPSPAQNFRL